MRQNNVQSRGSNHPRLVKIADRGGWYIRYRGVRRSTGESDRARAEQKLAAFVADLAAPYPGAAILVSTLLARYLADRVERGKPGAERLRWAHKPLVRHLGDTVPEAITEALCRSYAATRAREGVRPATARTELQALRAALRWAAGAGKLVATAPAITLPQRAPARDRWLTREEAAKLVDACASPHIRLFVLLALNTAARRGAVLALPWDRVDLERGVIDFRDPTRLETRKRRVAVPINATLRAALASAREGRVTPYVIEWAGGAVDSIKRGFRNACTRAGLAEVTPHVLRHTAVTWMMQAGVDIWQVAGMAGMTVEMVQAVYGHHHPAHLRSAADALG
jgi:integrase